MVGRQKPAYVADASADAHFMDLAISEARAAANAGEIPVGAIVVRNGVVIGSGRNESIGSNDPTAHAEIVALRSAASALKNYRLDGCSLYVTLEPCAMCAGAMLHARLDRVVYGAADPKTGAAGSVVDLFSDKQLNHHTEVTGGVLQEACGEALQAFFKQKRLSEKSRAQPLREDALRTPDARFAIVQDFSWTARYVSDLAGLNGLRLHYVDEGMRASDKVVLCLHANASWSYAFRESFATWIDAGLRVVAPDMIGFGKSDKPKKMSFHTVAAHQTYLDALIKTLDLKNILLVLQGPEYQVGHSLFRSQPDRFMGLATVGMPQRRDSDEKQAYDAPFPNPGYRAAESAFRKMGVSNRSMDLDLCIEKSIFRFEETSASPQMAK